MQTDGPNDYAVVNAVQKQYRPTPLSAWGQPYNPPTEVPVPPGIDTRPPLEQVQKMDAGAFYGRLARLMKDNPPASADAPIVEKLKKLGIVPGMTSTLTRPIPMWPRGCSARWEHSTSWKKA